MPDGHRRVTLQVTAVDDQFGTHRVFGLHLGEALVARHHAESAADLAALAAAAHMVIGEQYACSQARRVTDRMHVTLVSCRASDWDVLVDVAAQPPGWLASLGAATARARAGPA